LAIKAFISVPMLIFQSRVLGKKKEEENKDRTTCRSDVDDEEELEDWIVDGYQSSLHCC